MSFCCNVVTLKYAGLYAGLQLDVDVVCNNSNSLSHVIKSCKASIKFMKRFTKYGLV
jgi:hypothetical protein